MRQPNRLTNLDFIKNSPVAHLNQHLFDKGVLPAAPKKQKYNNIKVVVDGIEFDSQKEADYYGTLKVRQRIGEIKDLELQVRFELIPKCDKNRKMDYICDFRYFDHLLNKVIVTDVKSEVTRKIPAYIHKKKLMKTKYNIDIFEV